MKKTLKIWTKEVAGLMMWFAVWNFSLPPQAVAGGCAKKPDKAKCTGYTGSSAPPSDPCPPPTNQEPQQQSCGDECPKTNTGKPFATVNVCDGRVHHEVVDLSLGEKSRVLGPFEIRRTYVSDQGEVDATTVGHFGRGWSWEYDATAELRGSGFEASTQSVDASITATSSSEAVFMYKGYQRGFPYVGEGEDHCGYTFIPAQDAWSLDRMLLKPVVTPGEQILERTTFSGQRNEFTVPTSGTFRVGNLTRIGTLQDKHDVTLTYYGSSLDATDVPYHIDERAGASSMRSFWTTPKPVTVDGVPEWRIETITAYDETRHVVGKMIYAYDSLARLTEA